MGVKPGLVRPPSIGLLPPTGQRYQHDFLPPLYRPDATGHFVSVHSGHPDIQQGNFRLKLLDDP
jgi:hypothetical protein